MLVPLSFAQRKQRGKLTFRVKLSEKLIFYSITKPPGRQSWFSLNTSRYVTRTRQLNLVSSQMRLDQPFLAPSLLNITKTTSLQRMEGPILRILLLLYHLPEKGVKIELSQMMNFGYLGRSFVVLQQTLIRKVVPSSQLLQSPPSNIEQVVLWFASV